MRRTGGTAEHLGDHHGRLQRKRQLNGRHRRGCNGNRARRRRSLLVASCLLLPAALAGRLVSGRDAGMRGCAGRGGRGRPACTPDAWDLQKKRLKLGGHARRRGYGTARQQQRLMTRRVHKCLAGGTAALLIDDIKCGTDTTTLRSLEEAHVRCICALLRCAKRPKSSHGLEDCSSKPAQLV